MKIRRIFALGLLSLYTVLINAQPREDGGVTAKVISSSPVVTSIVGWEYGLSHQKWAGYYNTLKNIYKNNNNKTPIRLSASEMSGCKNVISLQVKKVEFEDETYFMLYYPFYAGAWRYPSIHQDWFYGKVTNLYVITEDEFDRLRDLDEDIICISVLKLEKYGHSSFCTYTDFNEAFNAIFESRKKLYRDSPLKFYIKREDQNTIRFQHISYGDLESGRDEDFGSGPNFDMRYFEVKYSEFAKLLIE